MAETKKDIQIKIKKTNPKSSGTTENDEQKVEEAVKEKKIFKDTDLIPCVCVFPGFVGMLGKRTRNRYIWEGMGIVEYVEYQDLRSEVLNKRSMCIYDPLIIIQDKDFLEENSNLSKLYDNFYTPNEIMENIEKYDVKTMIKFIKSLPEGTRKNVKNIVATMISNGTLDSVRKIKALDELFATNLQMYSYE